MATDVIEFEAPTGMALTVDVFPEGSDVASFAVVAATERVNDKGTYRADLVNPAAGVHRVNLKEGTAVIGKTWVRLANDGTVRLCGDRDARLALDADGRSRADVERWRAGTPNTLLAGRVEAHSAVVGDKTSYELSAAGVAAIRAKLEEAGSYLDALIARLTAARAAALDEVTAARMAELDAANLPADLGTLLVRLSAARAVLLDEITAARMAELDPANMPADLDTLKTRLPGVVQPQSGDSFTRLGAPAGASLAADVAAVKADTGPIRAKTDNLPAAPAAVGSPMTLAAAERTAVANALLDLADAVEAGLTTRGALRLALAALAGKVSGAGTATERFRSALADTKDRIVATVDAQGNRTAVAVDAS